MSRVAFFNLEIGSASPQGASMAKIPRRGMGGLHGSNDQRGAKALFAPPLDPSRQPRAWLWAVGQATSSPNHQVAGVMCVAIDLRAWVHVSCHMRGISCSQRPTLTTGTISYHRWMAMGFAIWEGR